MEVLSANNLDIGYTGPILSGLDFAIRKERITVILGKSGCGKSTLMKTLIGLLPPLAGTVSYLNNPIDFTSEEALRQLYLKIGVLYQNGALLNSLNLYENVALPLRMHHHKLQKEIEREMILSRLSQVGLRESAAKFPSELSGGMRKRGALARALILDPEVIFCDEPSAGLDPITAAGLDRLMLSLRDSFGMTLVVVTHELRSIEAIADDVVVLGDGNLHFHGEFKDLFSNNDPFIDTFFLKKGHTDD